MESEDGAVAVPARLALGHDAERGAAHVRETVDPRLDLRGHTLQVLKQAKSYK